MNERIKQLAEQATTYIEPTSTSGEGWIFDKEKFAELMLKKFDDILMLEQLDCIGNMDKKSVLLLDKIRERTKTYFGVEE
jgi:predicted nucleotide-binding protein (sugar kinase/HSP70/actin superfamily)